MREVLYVVRKKIYCEGRVYDWNGVSFDEVLGRIKKETGIKMARIVLGHEVSYVTAIKAEDKYLTREKVLKMIKPWMSFEIDNDCFDWKQVDLVYDEIWVQVVAMEKELLLSLSSAVAKHGIKVELITVVGVLLGGKTKGRESPVIIKWSKYENLFVLAINGLTDLVTSAVSEKDLMIYAANKWGLAVNPEIIDYNEDKFDLTKSAFWEKSDGEDRFVLSIPLMKGAMGELEDSEKKVELEKEKPRSSKNIIGLIFILLIVTILTVLVGLYVGDVIHY